MEGPENHHKPKLPISHASFCLYNKSDFFLICNILLLLYLLAILFCCLNTELEILKALSLDITGQDQQELFM